jgi:hypothetical protein
MLCFCCCYKRQAYEYENPEKEAEEENKALANAQMDDPDSRISAKNRMTNRNKCASCCCFLFCCASKTAV